MASSVQEAEAAAAAAAAASAGVSSEQSHVSASPSSSSSSSSSAMDTIMDSVSGYASDAKRLAIDALGGTVNSARGAAKYLDEQTEDARKELQAQVVEPLQANVITPAESAIEMVDTTLRSHPEYMALLSGGTVGLLGLSSGRGALQCMKRGVYGSVIGVGLGIGALFWASQDAEDAKAE